MKIALFFTIYLGCGIMLLTAVFAQENASTETWIYQTPEDFAQDNRLFPGEYTVAPDPRESPYKDSLKRVYVVGRGDGKRENDISRKAWGIVCDGKLYVNNQFLDGGKGYSKSFSTGRYHLFFTVLKESPASRGKFGYAKDDVRFYPKEQGKHRGTVYVGGVGVGLGSATFVFVPVVVDRKTGEMTAYSQAYMEQLGLRHPNVPPVPMNEARDARLIEYFRYLNALE